MEGRNWPQNLVRPLKLPIRRVFGNAVVGLEILQPEYAPNLTVKML